MSGVHNGLQKLELAPKAVYIHCYAQRLNLAIEAESNGIEFSSVISTVQTLYVYIEGSAERHAQFSSQMMSLQFLKMWA
jgi:hypothetical protein